MLSASAYDLFVQRRLQMPSVCVNLGIERSLDFVFIGGFMMHVVIDSTRNSICCTTSLDYQSCGFALSTAMQILSNYLTLPSALTFTPSKKHLRWLFVADTCI